MFDRAEIVLREFGNLRVQQTGPGHDFARSTFVIDPTLPGDGALFRRLEGKLGAPTYPLGEAVGGHAFMGIVEDGRVFLVMDDELFMVGRSIDEAMNSLIEGRRPANLNGG
jgi:hypothetical protein